jgi:hypothetical protein
LATFEGAEKSDGDAGGASDLSKRETTALAEAAETLAGRDGAFRRNRDNALELEDVNDGRRIQAARATEKNGALQKTNVSFAIKAVTAAGTLRREKTEGFPSAKSGGRNTDAARSFTDAQEPLGTRRN